MFSENLGQSAKKGKKKKKDTTCFGFEHVFFTLSRSHFHLLPSLRHVFGQDERKHFRQGELKELYGENPCEAKCL